MGKRVYLQVLPLALKGITREAMLAALCSDTVIKLNGPLFFILEYNDKHNGSLHDRLGSRQ